MGMLHVTSKGSVSGLARVLARALAENGGRVELRAVGPAAVHRAVKAVIVAQNGGRTGLTVVPGFVRVPGRNGSSLTAMRFLVEERTGA